jgi:hypothetical protein
MTIIGIEKDLFSDLISWTVPFLLGLFSSLIIDNLRGFRKKRRNKNFILYYLKNTILPVLPELESSYEKIRNIIQAYERCFFTLPAFEDFNTNVLNGIKPVEYFEIFKEKYVILNEIITMIEYLSENLPGKINNEFYNYIDNHLERINEIGNKEHVKTCPDCQSRQAEVITVLDLRIKEIKLLKNRIEQILK